MNAGIVLLLGFFLLMALRIPIAFALILVSGFYFVVDPKLGTWGIAERFILGVDSFVLLAVPFFILAAVLMNEAKITDRLLRLIRAIVGPLTGGLGMVNVGVSMAFAGVSGSAQADTAGIGSVLIPEMKKRGYPTDFTVAVTATSSVMGAIIPPSILMILWGSLTGTSIKGLFLGGILPGFGIGIGLLAYVYLVSRRHGYPKEPRISMRETVRAALDSALALGIPLLVIGGIVIGLVTATEAAVLAVLYALFLGCVVYRTLNLRNIGVALCDTVHLTALSMFAVGAASAVGFLLAYYRVPFVVSELFDGIPAFWLLGAIVLVWLVLGMFLDSFPAMVIMVPVFAPLVASAGIDPIQYGVVSIMTLAVGLATPPFGLCLLLASAIGGIPVARVLRSLVGPLVVMVGILCLSIFVPEFVLFVPSLF